MFPAALIANAGRPISPPAPPESDFVPQVPNTLVRPGTGKAAYKGANIIYYPAQGVRSCVTDSIYQGLNVGIQWIEFETTTVGGIYWQIDKAVEMGCNLIRCMQDGGGGSWLGLYDPGDYHANRAVAFARSVAVANYCASKGVYYYPTLNCCTYNGADTATNGAGGTGGDAAIADHAGAFCAAHIGLPNVIGVDVAQEFDLMRTLGTTTINSAGDATACVDPSSTLSRADTVARLTAIIAACRTAAPAMPLTASFQEGNTVATGSNVFVSQSVLDGAPLFDFLDFHPYYPIAGEIDGLYDQAGTHDKPFLLSETGASADAGEVAQSGQWLDVVSDALLTNWGSKPGCYGVSWWSLCSQDTRAFIDYGAYGFNGSNPPPSATARQVVDDITAIPLAFAPAQLSAKNFDALTIGALAGFTNGTGATFAVRAVNPVSGAKSFTESTLVPGDTCILSDITVPDDVCVQFSQKIFAVDGSNYNFIGPMLRCSDADCTNGYLFAAGYAPGHPELVRWILYKKTGGSFVSLGSQTGPTLLANDTVVIAKMQIYRSLISVKLWNASDPEPAGWLGHIYDTTFATGGSVGFRVGIAGTPGGNNAIDDFYVGEPGANFP